MAKKSKADKYIDMAQRMIGKALNENINDKVRIYLNQASSKLEDAENEL